MKNCRAIAVAATLVAFGLAHRARATITFKEQIKLDFDGSSPGECEWSNACALTNDGLALGANGDGWVQTRIHSARPAKRSPYWITLSLDVELASEQDRGLIHVLLRYSTDHVHWTDWQPPSGKTHHMFLFGPQYRGDIEVPSEVIKRSRELAKAAGTPDKGEVDGMDAYLRWLAARRPEIFEKVIPVVGYLQARIVNMGPSPVTIKSAEGQIEWIVSGASQVGKPLDIGKPWHFDLRDVASQPASQPAPPNGSNRRAASGPASPRRSNKHEP